MLGVCRTDKFAISRAGGSTVAAESALHGPALPFHRVAAEFTGVAAASLCSWSWVSKWGVAG